jgi:hypothetical protein
MAVVKRNHTLAAKERTDLIVLEWPHSTSTVGLDALTGLGQALLLAGARILEIDTRELGLCVQLLPNGSHGIVLFDTAPGGAGHCPSLLGLGRPWIESARQILIGTPEHHQRCQTACIDCILDFSAQHRYRAMNRRAALEAMNAVLLVG